MYNKQIVSECFPNQNRFNPKRNRTRHIILHDNKFSIATSEVAIEIRFPMAITDFTLVRLSLVRIHRYACAYNQDHRGR